MSSNVMKTAYQRELDVRYTPAVLVVGGGPAGIAAAVAAARQGASVRLIEAHGCLGGMGTAGMVPGFSRFSDGVNFVAGDIFREILDAHQDAYGSSPPDRRSIRAEVLKRVYDDLLTDAGIPFTFHTQLVDVNADKGRVREVVCAGRSGLFAIRAEMFIDCTGDGCLASLAGAPFEKGDTDGSMMPGTLGSLWAGIDWQTVRDSGLGIGNSRIEDAFKDGVFTIKDRHLPGMWRVGQALGGGNIGHTFDLDATDEESLTRAYLWGRKSLLEYERYYKQYLKGFEKMELVATGSLMGVRETRRIIGDYVLNIQDYDGSSSFDDEIGRYCHPIDVHSASPDIESYEKSHRDWKTKRLGKGESYGIPYRILTPRGLDNTLVAGRCVSADRSMHGSIRVMPACFITGQAAGVAAAMATRAGSDTRGIEIRDLQMRLKAMGAYLPNLEK